MRRGWLALASGLLPLLSCTHDGGGPPVDSGVVVDGAPPVVCVDAGVDGTPRHRVGPYATYLGTLHDHIYALRGGDDGGIIAGNEPGVTGSAEWLAFRQQNPARYAGGDPRSAIQKAKTSGLDFFALTPHNHLVDGEEFADITAAVTESRCGSFVVLLGQEYSTVASGNHMTVFQTDIRIGLDGGRFDLLYANWLPSYESAHPEVAGNAGMRPFAAFAHPSFTASEYTLADKARLEYGIDDFPTLAAWADASNKYVRLVEVLSGSGGDTQNRPRVLELLNNGARVGMSVGEDNHDQQYGTRTDSRVGVLATGQSISAIAEALYQRRTFASEDKTLGLHVVAKLAGGDRYMGSDVTVAEAGAMLPLEIGLEDAGEPGATYRIEVLRDDAVGGAQAAAVTVAAFASPVAAGTYQFQVATPPAGGYVMVHVTQLGSATDDVWVSPFFIRP